MFQLIPYVMGWGLKQNLFIFYVLVPPLFYGEMTKTKIYSDSLFRLLPMLEERTKTKSIQIIGFSSSPCEGGGWEGVFYL
jgi:hypothetical protein